jgi:hypothetical protein
MNLWEYIGLSGQSIRTLSGTPVATAFTRIVHGSRGAYVEFQACDVYLTHLFIPAGQEWRVDSKVAYYIEHRTKDATLAKVYHQLRLVTYADYLVGMYYISPTFLMDFRASGKTYRMAEV